LNVSVDHANDSVKIGDGTRLVGTTTNNELKINDADTNTKLATIDTVLDNIKLDTTALVGVINVEETTVSTNGLAVGGINSTGDFKKFKVESDGSMVAIINGVATETKQDTQITALGSLLTELQAKADLSETQPVSIAGTVAVSGPLTDAQLRATAVPISGGFLTDAQLRATAVPVSVSGVATEAKQDTQVTALNEIRDRLPPAIGENGISASLSVTPALGTFFSVLPRPLTNSYDEKLTLTSVSSFTAPTNAIGGKIMAHDANLANIRYKQGGAATVTSGMQLQAGRSEDFSGGDSISVISESGTNAVFVQWTIQA
jgi:hypothetical protein